MATRLRVVERIAEIAATDWDALANPPGEPDNPSVSHAFLDALEESGCVGGKTGWLPRHLVLEEGGSITGVVPCYLKSHSMGEYVFDHGFADALHRAGGRYYPKLQVSVPFTPVPGPRLMAATCERKRVLAEGLQQMAEHRRVVRPSHLPAGTGLAKPHRARLPATAGHPVPLAQSRLQEFRRLPCHALIGKAQDDPQGA